MAFPPAFLEELRARLTLSSLVGRRTRLVKAGREYKACCPFHNEKTPSFYVNDDKQFFHCFGCGAHGDVIGFTMRADHLSFPEAIEKLAGEAGLDVPRMGPAEREKAERAKTLGDAVEAACVWYQEKLRAPEGRAALAYLHGRGLSDDTIERFRLGYAPEGWRNLAAALKLRGFDEAMLLEAGLITKPEDRPEPFDFFRNRVMFPITDRRGRVIAFGGRVMDDSKPKYLNSRDTPLFHKRGNLYALDKARLGVGERKARALVAEGYMDVIALHQAGFVGAVAPLGTALTEEQMEALWRIHPEPIVCLDGDAAGQRAALKAAETALPLLKPGRALRFAVLPAEDDPDSLIKRDGAAAFERLLERTKGIDDVVWESEIAKGPVDTPDRRATLDAALRARLARIADKTVQKAYENEWVWTRLRRLGRPEPVRRFQTFQGGGPGKGKPGPGGRRDKPGPRDFGLRTAGNPDILGRRAQKLLLTAVLHHPELLWENAETFAEIGFSDPVAARLRAALLDCAHEAAAAQSPLDSQGVIAHLSGMGLAEEAASLTKPSSYEHGAFAGPGASQDEARAGFRSVLSLLARPRIEEELREAARAVADAPEPELLARVDALTAILRDLNAQGGGDEDDAFGSGGATGH
jgi:DNA primase